MRIRTLWRRLRRHPLARVGPGFMTGVADDDPSGIATYSQAGAQYGLGMLWTMPLSFPLMAAVFPMPLVRARKDAGVPMVAVIAVCAVGLHMPPTRADSSSIPLIDIGALFGAEARSRKLGSGQRPRLRSS
jgi:hypothetical protein